MRRARIALILAAAAAAAGIAGVAYWRESERTLRSAVAQHRHAAADRTPSRSVPVDRTPSRSVPVEIARARAATTTKDIQAIGSLQSDESVKIAPEIAGRIAEIAFREGQPVSQGDVLVRLDDALAQAEVDDAQARFELAQANYERATALARRGAGTERARDEAIAAFETGRVALELARVRLSKHTIRAPFAGVVGLRKISVGAFVSVGTELVNLEKLDALKVDFKVPELFLDATRVGQTVEVSLDALPNRTFSGTIYAIDPMVDMNGRALQVRARLPNPEGLLRPGLFARITVKGVREETVVIVPESAVVPRGGETYVYRVEAGRALEAKVRLGQRRAGEVEIVDGLAGDATVVVAGHQRLRDGVTVEVVASGRPTRG